MERKLDRWKSSPTKTMRGIFNENIFTDEFSPIEVTDSIEQFNYERVERITLTSPRPFDELDEIPNGGNKESYPESWAS